MTTTEYERAASDFRSDTVTVPNEEMLKTCFTASLGDNMYDEDETTNKLEREVAALFGHEAGIFVPSGTFSNQLAIRTHLKEPPHSILCNYEAHINVWEGGALSILNQTMIRPVPAIENGLYATCKEFEKYCMFRQDIHAAPTTLICLENTINGVIVPFEELEKISNFARENKLAIHLDGARIAETWAATNVPFTEFGRLFDTISMCLSKGIGAPIGTVLVGPKEFITRAKRFRKNMGGAMRQCGIVTGPALWCLENNLSKLKDTHTKAKAFSEYAESLNISLQLPVQTNIVFLNLKKAGVDVQKFIEIGKRNGLKLGGERVVFHYQISDESCETLKKVLKEVVTLAN